MNRHNTITVLVGLALLGVGALVWATMRDPFQRDWFRLEVDDAASTKCVVLRPKTISKPAPLVVYLHDASANLLSIGTSMRQIAELGLAVMGIEYNQTNQLASARQFEALIRFVAGEQWVDTNAIAWVGAGLGAQRALGFAIRHPELRPRLLIGLRPGRLDPAELSRTEDAPAPKCSALLLHDADDRVFSEADSLRTAQVLRTNGITTQVKVLGGSGWELQANADVVYRWIGEHTLAYLKGPNALLNYRSLAAHQSSAKPLWIFWVPAALWGLLRVRKSVALANWHCKSIWLRAVAGIMAMLALGQTVVQLSVARTIVSAETPAMAHKRFIQPRHRAYFDSLANESAFKGTRVKSLLDHIELADYNRGLVGWTVDEAAYRAYVLSPDIIGEPDERPYPQRALWEHFYPRIRKEHDIRVASELIVRELRAKITIAEGSTINRRPLDMWRRQLADQKGFNILYVATLRAVGIPARLTKDQAEIQVQSQWQPAPRPILDTWAGAPD